jgi:hypothetical protein
MIPFILSKGSLSFNPAEHAAKTEIVQGTG